jgi:hypothetical protein
MWIVDSMLKILYASIVAPCYRDTDLCTENCILLWNPSPTPNLLLDGPFSLTAEAAEAPRGGVLWRKDDPFDGVTVASAGMDEGMSSDAASDGDASDWMM